MINYLFNKSLRYMSERYDYDVRYMQDVLQADLGAFLKFSGFQIMSAHKGKLPVDVLFAARLRSILWDDCGPCIQLVVNMALEAKVKPEVVRAIIEYDLANMPEEIALITQFTDLTLAHSFEADELREEVLLRWGKKGLIALGLAISSSRVYPTLKYTLGYGNTCSRINVQDLVITPRRQPMETHHE